MLYLADTALRSVGECAGLVAEHLAFEQVVRQATTIDGDERLRSARAVMMQVAGNELLSGSRLALKHDVRGWACQIENKLPYATDSRRAAEDRRLDAVLIGELGPQRPDLEDKVAMLRRSRRHFDQPVRGKGLLNEVVGTETHGIHGHGDIAMAGDQDYGEVFVDRSGLRQKS